MSISGEIGSSVTPDEVPIWDPDGAPHPPLPPPTLEDDGGDEG